LSVAVHNTVIDINTIVDIIVVNLTDVDSLDVVAIDVDVTIVVITENFFGPWLTTECLPRIRIRKKIFSNFCRSKKLIEDF